MLIIDANRKSVIIRKSQPDDYDYYALILRHDATGEVFVFNVGNESNDRHYFKFTVDLEGLPYGEYTYWIVGNDPQWILNIDVANIERSCYTIKDSGDEECYPLDFLRNCMLQYYSFENNLRNTCYTYKGYECCKEEE